jgi:hypothetical protein
MSVEHVPHDVRLHGFSAGAPEVRIWVRSVLALVRRKLCAIRGHDLLLRAESRRLSLRCLDCGWESPGWVIDRPRFSYDHSRSVPRKSKGVVAG